MSTQITTFGVDAIADTSSKRPGLFQRIWAKLLAAGEAHGQRRLVNYFASLPASRLEEIGYTKAQIRQIRVERTLPVLGHA
jgi:hypothetical protein